MKPRSNLTQKGKQKTLLPFSRFLSNKNLLFLCWFVVGLVWFLYRPPYEQGHKELRTSSLAVAVAVATVDVKIKTPESAATKDVIQNAIDCTSAALFADPSKFANCLRPDYEASTCDSTGAVSGAWDSWVGPRYKAYTKEECITPEVVSRKGKNFAISGRGSTVEYTKELRNLLPTIFQKYKIQTFLDCPCGDFMWMQLVTNLNQVQYFGADITKQTVEYNTHCFESSRVHFHVIDWSCVIPPPVDLLLVRDVLFHLSTSRVLGILNHINQSGAKYLLTTSFGSFSQGVVAVDNYEIQEHGVGYRDINLYGRPYNFPEPIMQANESKGRHVGLWKLPIETIEF